MADQPDGNAPPVHKMMDMEKVIGWSQAEVGQWLASIGAETAIQYFQNHGIEGRDLCEMGKDDLRYMQVPVGPSLRVMIHLKDLYTQKKHQDDKRQIQMRNKIIKNWQTYYGNCACMCFSSRRRFLLTGNSMKVIDAAHPCCGDERVNNIDLTSITDIDNHKPGFVCSELITGEKGYIDVTSTSDPPLKIVTKKDETTAIAKILRETWELAQLQTVRR